MPPSVMVVMNTDQKLLVKSLIAESLFCQSLSSGRRAASSKRARLRPDQAQMTMPTKVISVITVTMLRSRLMSMTARPYLR